MFYCRVEHVLDSAGTSVAPPERTARSSAASFLPPAPTLSGRRARVDREPEITTTLRDTSEEKDEVEKVSENEEGSEEKAPDEKLDLVDNKVVSPLKFGSPKGSIRSVASQSKETIKIGDILIQLDHMTKA